MNIMQVVIGKFFLVDNEYLKLKIDEDKYYCFTSKQVYHINCISFNSTIQQLDSVSIQYIITKKILTNITV